MDADPFSVQMDASRMFAELEYSRGMTSSMRWSVREVRAKRGVV